jgi:hypothetical protein
VACVIGVNVVDKLEHGSFYLFARPISRWSILKASEVTVLRRQKQKVVQGKRVRGVSSPSRFLSERIYISHPGLVQKRWFKKSKNGKWFATSIKNGAKIGYYIKGKIK